MILRLLFATCLVASGVLAKTHYRIAVCGVSRSSEELEMALELNDSVLVKPCDEKKLDAKIKIEPKAIKAFGGQGLLLSQSRTGALLTTAAARSFVNGLLKSLAKKPEKLLLEKPKPEVVTRAEELVEENPEQEPEPMISQELVSESKIKWRLESLASLDQWSYQINSKFYPGFQMATQVELAQNWILQSRFAFGTSAFLVDEQKFWNQQLSLELSTSKLFELETAWRLGPRLGYLYWGSYSGLDGFSQFQRHDVSLGFEAKYRISRLDLEIAAQISALPVNWGLNSSIAARYYFQENWFAVVNTGLLAMWAHAPESTFLSGSMGLGVML